MKRSRADPAAARQRQIEAIYSEKERGREKGSGGGSSRRDRGNV